MKRLIPLLAAGVLSGAFAQPVYKCTHEGRTTYADRPCAQGKSVELPPPAGIRPEGAETVATRDARTLVELEKLRLAREQEQRRSDKADARTARAAAAHRKQCARLHLRRQWAEEDAARLTGRGRVAAQRRAQRAREAMAVECPA
ncbi:DUF4124 domain-containing protein [Massilia luteola]|uniref:DUF4124 domain-containing protein n=1 Tax=Massilia luteola TaxID=3081751 RepID=UPI002ACBF53A|nr:DUF4124 domain-containing protein [Massilia sp. Gc5]